MAAAAPPPNPPTTSTMAAAATSSLFSFLPYLFLLFFLSHFASSCMIICFIFQKAYTRNYSISSVLPQPFPSKLLLGINLIVALCIFVESLLLSTNNCTYITFTLNILKTLKITPTCFDLVRSSSGSFLVPC